MTATLEHHAGLHTLRFERLLEHPMETVWRALTDNDELAHWFPAVIHGAREAGAELRFVMPAEAGQVPADSTVDAPPLTGDMRIFDPPHTLEYSWDGEVLRWELHAKDGATRLIFTHTFSDEAKAARDAAGWEFCLAGLEGRLAGRPRVPFSWEGHNAIFDRYAKRFGPKASVKRGPEE